MTRPPQLRLFAERPVRSYDMRERSYARRRMITVGVLLLVVAGGAYAIWGRGPKNPADIPTIQAEGVYKQKPADPGGIDIPHQDVRVYDQLEGKNGAPVQVEHLLPPPETPKDMPHAVAAAPEAVTPPAAAPAPAPAPAPIAAAPTPEILPAPVPRTVATTVAPVPAPVPAPTPPPAATPETPPLSIDQIIANTKAPASPAPATAPAPAPLATGMAAIQLASSNDEAKARGMMQDMQQKYAAQLGGTVLHLTRADLGSRGIFYRIQSQGMSESDANHICSSLKQMNAGCILVRK